MWLFFCVQNKSIDSLLTKQQEHLQQRRSTTHWSYFFNIFWNKTVNPQNFSYIFDLLSSSGYCITTLVGVHKYLCLWHASLERVIEYQMRLVHYYNIFANSELTEQSKMSDIVLRHVSTRIHSNVSKVYQMSLDTNVLIVLPFILSCIFSADYSQNENSNLKSINRRQTDYNVPINSFDIIAYYDLLWGQLEDLYLCKWGAILRYDDWLFSLQSNFVGSQIIQFIATQVEKVLKSILHSTNKK